MTTVKTSMTQQRFIPGGQVFFNPLVGGTYQGEFYLGLTSVFDVSVKSSTVISKTSDYGPLETDMEIPVEIDRTADLSCRQIGWNQLAWFYIGNINELVQEAGAIIAEEWVVKPDFFYQLGTTVLNPTGVRNISAVTVALKRGSTAAAAQTTHAYDLHALVQPATPNAHFYECTTAGTSGSSAPTWKTDGTATTDGTVTWADRGTFALTAVTDYTVDLALARLYVAPTGRVLAAGETLLVNYTKAAATRTQIEASSLAVVSGQLRYIAIPAEGEPRDLFAPNVTLIPNGKFALKSSKPDFVELAWTLAFARGLNGESPLLIDGRAV